MRGYLQCTRCGLDNKIMAHKFDEYWTDEDENQVVEEMDDFFYERYPEYK